MLRATTACTFSTSQLPKVVREWCALSNLTWKCASRHNGVQFFISHLASWLRTRRFSEVIFSTLRSPKSVEKQSESRLSYLFAHLHLLASHFFFSLIFSLLGFSSLTLSTSAFPSLHFVGSLTSKLPSISMMQHSLQLVTCMRVREVHTRSSFTQTAPDNIQKFHARPTPILILRSQGAGPLHMVI